MLDAKQKACILRIARETLEHSFDKRKPLSPVPDDAVFKEKRGVFVTLKKGGRLRGCIGTIMPVEPLVEAVRHMALEAAFDDPRFSPVTQDELPGIVIEISVLTVPKKVVGAEAITLGIDGVIVKKGFHQGVFLPQVAQETGWSKEEFLSELCSQKAGLSPDAWKHSDVELYTFQAEVFSEEGA